MVWKRTGSCNQCGECCKLTHPLMTNQTKDACKHLELRIDGLYYCKITDAVFGQDTAKRAEINQEEYDFWKSQCLPYPNPDDDGHTPPEGPVSYVYHTLPEKCSFKFVKVE